MKLKEIKAERLEQRRKDRKHKRKIEAVEVKKAEEEKLGVCRSCVYCDKFDHVHFLLFSSTEKRGGIESRRHEAKGA